MDGLKAKGCEADQANGITEEAPWMLPCRYVQTRCAEDMFLWKQSRRIFYFCIHTQIWENCVSALKMSWTRAFFPKTNIVRARGWCSILNCLINAFSDTKDSPHQWKQANMPSPSHLFASHIYVTVTALSETRSHHHENALLIQWVFSPNFYSQILLFTVWFHFFFFSYNCDMPLYQLSRDNRVRRFFKSLLLAFLDILFWNIPSEGFHTKIPLSPITVKYGFPFSRCLFK